MLIVDNFIKDTDSKTLKGDELCRNDIIQIEKDLYLISEIIKLDDKRRKFKKNQLVKENMSIRIFKIKENGKFEHPSVLKSCNINDQFITPKIKVDIYNGYWRMDRWSFPEYELLYDKKLYISVFDKKNGEKMSLQNESNQDW